MNGLTTKRKSAKQNKRKRKKPKKFMHIPNNSHRSVVHPGIHPHRCQDCDEYFPSVDELERHFCEHSRDKSFACGVCFQSFNNTHSLGLHRRAVHCNTSAFICDICSKSFRTYSLVRRHMVRHTGELPYQCDNVTSVIGDSHENPIEK